MRVMVRAFQLYILIGAGMTFCMEKYDPLKQMERQPARKLYPTLGNMPATPLENAIRSHNLPAVRQALEHSPRELNRLMGEDRFPGRISMLGRAIEGNDFPIAQVLVERGAEIYPYDVVRAYLRDKKGDILVLLLSQPRVQLKDFFTFLDQEKLNPRVDPIQLSLAQSIAGRVAEAFVQEALELSGLTTEQLEAMSQEQKEAHKERLKSVLNSLGVERAHDKKVSNPLHVAFRTLGLAEWLANSYPEFLTQTNEGGDTPLELGFGLYQQRPEFRELLSKLTDAGIITASQIFDAKRKTREQKLKHAREMAQELEEEEKTEK